LFIADFLPRWHKLWFVAESGSFSTSGFVSLLLIVALFKRWRHAFGLIVGWLVVRLCFSASIMYYNITHDGPILGYLCLNTLNLAALGILCCSSDIRRYLNDKPVVVAQEQPPRA
jgi:uncharacterized membrane protein